MEIRGRTLLMWAFATAVVLSSVRSAEAQDAERVDLAARIEYAYYTADIASLQRDLTAYEKLSGQGGDELGYLNYGRWKFAQLVLAAKRKDLIDSAATQAQRCNEAPSTKLDNSVQATQLALASACALMLERLRPLRAVLYRGERRAHLEQAMQLGAEVAQVQLIQGWQAVIVDAARTERMALLRAAVARYEDTAAATGWGYAEALYLLAAEEQQQGNTLAARDALESTLVQAPDYRDARQLMQQLFNR